MLQLQSFLGIAIFIAIAFFFSVERKKVSLKLVASALGLQFFLAIFVLGVPVLGFQGPLREAFGLINQGIMDLIGFTDIGSRFLFADYGDRKVKGFIFAFQVLPIIVFISALMTVLYHLKIMQWIVYAFAVVMQRVLGISGAESLAAAANVFVGQTEAPLVVRPYLDKMTGSEIFSVMTGGMATVAGSVLGAYVFLLDKHIPGVGGHLLAASIISAPAALMIAKIMVPENKKPETLGTVPNEKQSPYINVVEAAANGASEGVKLAINVAGMLLAFIALIALFDGIFATFGRWVGFPDWGVAFSPEAFLIEGKAQLSLSLVLGWLFTPVAFFLGIPSQDIFIAASLIGKKVVINEFIAYEELARLGDQLHPRTLLIMSYALCGFANFSSIAIQIGGIGSLAPKRRGELAMFGLRAVLGGTLAAFLTACFAGILT